MDKKTEYDTLVLSGGGVKGYILLGAIQSALDLKMISDVKTYVGTSIGSVISYLLAIGYSPVELMVALHIGNWMEKLSYFDLVSMTNGNGASSFTPIQECLEKLTIDKIGKFITLGKLKEEFGKTLICTTYNMTTCKMEYLSPDTHHELPCLTALRMSANIPLVFDRFKYTDCFYVDGGIGDNFPIITGEEHGEKVLGFNMKADVKSLQDNPDDGIISYFFRLLQVPVKQATEYRLSTSTEKSTIIHLFSGNLKSPLEFSLASQQRLEMFSEGYQQTKEFFKT